MVAAVVAIDAAVDLLVELTEQASRVSQIIQAAQQANQTMLSADQWSAITGDDDSAIAALNAAIAAAKAVNA